MVLKEVDLVQVRRSGEHFKKILRQIFEHIPRSAHSIAGLARWTGINKSTCQRLVQALTKSKDGIDVIVTLPGTNGLNQFYAKFKSLLKNKECLDNFQSLINEYQNLIFDYATSQSELKRKLLFSKAQNSASGDTYTKKLRKVAFETNKEICGEEVDLYLGIHVTRVNKRSKNYLDEIIIANRVGVQFTKNARPFVQAFGGNHKPIQIDKPKLFSKDNLPKNKIIENSSFLFTDFSSAGVEKCFAGVGGLGFDLIYNHTLEPINSEKFDITLANLDLKTQLNPMKKGHKVICQSISQRSPAKRLVLLSMIEKDFAKLSSIQAGCYPISIKALEMVHTPDDLWSERFSDSPEIMLFKPEEEKLSAKSGVAHIDELLAQTFMLLNDDPSNYVGFYLDVDYPLWHTAHRFYYEFT
ncbi:hypothetical protein [Aliikangiella sp. IMCC44359]|uniref:hypothetical protein n=1 Tax=Aliikangiella sp. IMCC44359 TaxID=3459125 RepID=UPI00403AC257